jgi:hypothetical protein
MVLVCFSNQRWVPFDVEAAMVFKLNDCNGQRRTSSCKAGLQINALAVMVRLHGPYLLPPLLILRGFKQD